MNNPYITTSQKKQGEQLLFEYSYLVKRIAFNYESRTSQGLKGELFQVGMQGLLDAIHNYDKTKGASFKTYAEIRIRGAILDDLRKQDWIPRSVRESSNKLEKAYIALRKRNIDHPKDKDLAKELDIPLKKLPQFLDKARPIPLLSLDANYANSQNDSSNVSLADMIPDDDEDTPIEQLLLEEKKEALKQAIKKLPKQEQFVLSLYYNEDANLKEIAIILGLTEARVSQIRTKAIAMLRSHLAEYKDS